MLDVQFQLAAKGKVEDLSIILNAQPNKITYRDRNNANLIHYAAASDRIKVLEHIFTMNAGAECKYCSVYVGFSQ